MSARTRLALDVGTFAALLVAFNPAWTGIAVHEWLSLAVIVPLLVHTIVNWEWTVRTIERFAERLLHVSRLNLLVDAALFVSAVAVMLSGLMISHVVAATFGIATSANSLWAAVHSLSADTTIALLLVHFGLHWRWVLNVSRRLLAEPAAQTATTHHTNAS